MSVSGANMLLQTTFGVVVFCVLVGNLSTYEVRNYQVVKSDNGQWLCATSPPNKTVNEVAPRSKCFILCDRGCQSPCQGINYHKTAQRCELFYYEPCSYDLQPDCVNFMLQVVNDLPLVQSSTKYSRLDMQQSHDACTMLLSRDHHRLRPQTMAT